MKKVVSSADLGVLATHVLPVLIDTAEKLVVILDQQGRVIEFNRSCRDATGFAADEVLGRAVWDVLVCDSEVAEVKELFRRCASSTQPIHHRGHWVAKDGSRRLIEWTNVVVRGEGVEPWLMVATGIDLTDRTSVSEADRQSLGYLKGLVTALNENILVIDRDFKIIDVNDCALATTGHTRDEVVGHHCYEISHGYNRPCAERGEDCPLTRVFATGRPESCHHVHTGKNGSLYHVDVAMAPLFDGDGVVRFVVESARDVTEAIGIASRLEDSEGRFRALVESMADGFAIDDPDGNLTFVNRTLCRMLGYAREDLLGRPLADYLDPASRETLWEHSVQRSLDPDAGTESYELKVQRADGTMVEVLVSPQRMVNNDLEYEGSFAVMTDISRLKRMERTQLLLGTAIEQAAESVVITDIDGNIQYVNPAFERTTGYSSDEVIGSNPRILKSGEHDEAFYRDLWETITGGRVWSGQFTNLRRDGVLYLEETTISPVRGESGTIEAFVAVKRDVSVEHDLVEQLNRAQKLEALGELAGGIAHDLNNLLLNITGAAELLRLRLPSNDDGGSELETIRETVVRGADLTRHLLAVAQQRLLEIVAFDLDEVIQSELEDCRSLFPDSVSVDFSPSDTPPVVLGDRGLLAQVLVSLCANARDAMPNGGTLSISTATITADALLLAAHSGAEEGRYARLRIEDDGTGMESKVRDRAFDPFFSTKKGSQSSGMGLASVYGIVQQHRGMVELESSPGMGTRIDIYLPLTTEPLAAVVEDSHPDSVGGHETILVVEDEDRVRRTQVKMLEALGYTVVEAANGKIALGVLADNENPVDLILSDVSMPEMGGQDLYDQARGLHPEIAFVFTSGYTGTSFLDRFQHGETVHFLPKPHSMADLAGIIRRALVGS